MTDDGDMTNQDLPWFKVWHEMKGDMKFSRIARELNLDFISIAGAWTLILCAAAASPIRGSLHITSGEAYNLEDVSALLRTPNDLTNKLVNAFMEKDMLTLEGNGTLTVTNFEKRQESADPTAKDRMKKWRSRNVTRNGRVTVTRNVTRSLRVESESESESESENKNGGGGSESVTRNVTRNVTEALPIPEILPELKVSWGGVESLISSPVLKSAYHQMRPIRKEGEVIVIYVPDDKIKELAEARFREIIERAMMSKVSFVQEF